MKKQKYYCPKCKRNHYVDSPIGIQHYLKYVNIKHADDIIRIITNKLTKRLHDSNYTEHKDFSIKKFDFGYELYTKEKYFYNPYNVFSRIIPARFIGEFSTIKQVASKIVSIENKNRAIFDKT